MAFTGQVLRFDQDAYWGLGIGASISSRVPLVGDALVQLLLGGPIIGGATLSRFFALHVFVVPGLLIGAVTLHVLMVLKLGVNEWPMPGRIVRRSTYLEDYQRAHPRRRGALRSLRRSGRTSFFSGAMVLAVIACAALLGPFGPSGPPDPTIIQTAPRPDYFFLWIYALLSYLPPSAETPVLLIAPVLVIAVLVLLPFVAGEGEKSWRRRPIAVLSVVAGGGRARGRSPTSGQHTPWSPVMDAWSSEPIPDAALAGRTALQRRGAVVFQAKQCHNCHALGGRGGQRGPALDEVAVTPHPGPARPPGHPGRGQHARLRQEPQPRRDHRAGGVPRNPPSARAGAGARRLADGPLRQGALMADTLRVERSSVASAADLLVAPAVTRLGPRSLRRSSMSAVAPSRSFARLGPSRP